MLVARGSAREKSFDSDIEKETRRRMELIRNKEQPVPTAELLAAQKQIREQVKADYQVVAPGHARPWQIDLGLARNS